MKTERGEKKQQKILVVEDDASISFGLKEVFEGEGFEVACCDRGDEVERMLAARRPDVVLLDVMLPGKNGFEIAKSIRASGDRVPIVMLTSKGQELDKVVGLDSGADDYVTKPFGVRELVARVYALLRRAGDRGGGGADSGEHRFTVGEAEVNRKTFEVCVGGKPQRLTPKEMDLLVYLHTHRGEVLSRDDILDAVWGMQYFGTTRTLDQCVAQVRRKIGDSGASPRFLQTVHGVGYKLV
jgi:DNA-binding response OmpR family regulator